MLIDEITIASIEATRGHFVFATITKTISYQVWRRDIAVGIILRIVEISITSIEAALGCIIFFTMAIAISYP
jgi:hypothetical protein